MLRDSAAVDTPAARPHFIVQDGHHLFAWHHPARPAVRRGAAVVLCPSLGGELVRAYRVWRLLAEQLAAMGFDVFRFDYEGTGDSAGDLTEPDRVEAWVRNIDRVVKQARTLTGSHEVALVGLRISGMLAVQAAVARGGVDRLVLWGPCRSGRTYVRELKALARLSQEPYVDKEDDGSDILAAGIILPRPIASALERLDLEALSVAPAPHVLIIERDDRAPDPAVGDRLQRLGSSVTCVRPAGTGKMLEIEGPFDVPTDAFDAITSWLDEWPSSGKRGVAIEESAAGSSPFLHGSGYHERPIRFGPGDRLFGILSAPSGADRQLPAIIFLNTGVDYRVGRPHRFQVTLAREWAAKGHVVFRYDLGGLGDSVQPPGAGANDPYPAHALDDLREAIAFMRTQAAGCRLIVAGICAGGWHAFQAARTGLPVDAIVAINPPLYLRGGVSKTDVLNQYRQVEAYQTAFRDRARWSRVLRGRSSYRTFLRVAARYTVKAVRSGIGAAFGGRFVDGLAGDLTGISARGVTSCFVFSRRDGGHEYFKLHAGATVRRRSLRDRISLSVVDDAGHTFDSPAAQQTLRRILVEFVEDQTRESADARGGADPFRPADHRDGARFYRRKRRPA